MILALLGQALAQSPSNFVVPICIEFKTFFLDAGSSWKTPGPGDFWNVNTDKPARYLKIQVMDDVSTKTAWLDAAGCTTLLVQLYNGSPLGFDITAWGHARPRGIDVELKHHHVPDDDPSFPYWSAAVMPSVTWTGLGPPTVGNTLNLHIDAVAGWQVLAVATWMLHRNDLHLDLPNSRDCCLKPSQHADGTCLPAPAPAQRYARTKAPYWTFAPKVAILTHASSRCCGSDFRWTSNPDDFRSGFVGSRDAPLGQHRFTLAHELGHVMVGIRMGGKERNQYHGTAPDDGCSSEFISHDGVTWDPIATNARGTFTKEYGSIAAREGWADFMAHWTWNARTEPNCASANALTRVDFDFDGDGNDNRSAGAAYSITDCQGDPLWVVDPLNPLASWVSDRNWLNDVRENVTTCSPASYCLWPNLDTVIEKYNRATVYDWSKLFWAMTQTEDVPPQYLSDLYVDMCPRGWQDKDGGIDCMNLGGFPYARLSVSASHNGLSVELANQIDHVVD